VQDAERVQVARDEKRRFDGVDGRRHEDTSCSGFRVGTAREFRPQHEQGDTQELLAGVAPGWRLRTPANAMAYAIRVRPVTTAAFSAAVMPRHALDLPGLDVGRRVEG